MLNKHDLSVAEFASKEKSSYTLQAIQVTPKETYATDQYRLVRVSRGNAPKVGSFPARAGFQAVEITEPFLLSAETALAVRKALPKKASIPVLEYAGVGAPEENGERSLLVTDLEQAQRFTSRGISKRFPSVANVWKRAEDATLAVSFDAGFLMELCRAVVEFTGRKPQPTVTLRFFGTPEDAAQSSMRLDAHNECTGQHWTALLMPIRHFVPGEEPEFAASESSESVTVTSGDGTDAIEVTEGDGDELVPQQTSKSNSVLLRTNQLVHAWFRGVIQGGQLNKMMLSNLKAVWAAAKAQAEREVSEAEQVASD